MAATSVIPVAKTIADAKATASPAPELVPVGVMSLYAPVSPFPAQGEGVNRIRNFASRASMDTDP